ncbi:MAG: ThuA domain-containing protein [Tepidisphaerales bacterium]
MPIRVCVWGEYRHEKKSAKVAEIYPNGMHEAIASALRKCPDFEVSTAYLDQDAQHGLSDEKLSRTDVLTWWGHLAHHEVSDAVVEKVCQRVLQGMGLIVLHSGHYSKVFRRLMGTTCSLKWRESNDREILWVTRPGHPITAGIDDHFILPAEEMYGEFFDIPEPMETVFISTFTGGECFRSGLTYTRGAGKIFYFRPGHETYPTYHDRNVLRVIENAVRWARPAEGVYPIQYGNRKDGWLDGK